VIFGRPRTVEEAAESWRRRFGYQALSLCRRHALAHDPGEHREFWLQVVAVLERDLTRQPPR
jgi:hypothetical protein